MAGVAGSNGVTRCGSSRLNSRRRRPRWLGGVSAARRSSTVGHRRRRPCCSPSGRLVITTLPAADWPLVDVLRLYRARWQVELVFKRMKPLLRLNQIRSTHRISVEATVRALLVARALQEGVMAELRTLLAPGAHRVHPNEPLAAHGPESRHAAAAGAGHMGAGSVAGMLAALASLSRAQSTPPGSSGNGCTGVARRTSPRTSLQAAGRGMRGSTHEKEP